MTINATTYLIPTSLINPLSPTPSQQDDAWLTRQVSDPNSEGILVAALVAGAFLVVLILIFFVSLKIYRITQANRKRKRQKKEELEKARSATISQIRIPTTDDGANKYSSPAAMVEMQSLDFGNTSSVSGGMVEVKVANTRIR